VDNYIRESDIMFNDYEFDYEVEKFEDGEVYYLPKHVEEYDIDILSLEESMENAYISMGYSVEDKNLYNLINSLFNEGE
jgi:hypothetical protein